MYAGAAVKILLQHRQHCTLQYKIKALKAIYQRDNPSLKKFKEVVKWDDQ